MTAHLCLVCGRPTPDGLVCTDETASAALSLAEIAEVVPAARDVAHGLSRRSQGGGSGKPGSRLPFDLSATSRLDQIQNELTTLARHVAAERGLPL